MMMTDPVMIMMLLPNSTAMQCPTACCVKCPVNPTPLPSVMIQTILAAPPTTVMMKRKIQEEGDEGGRRGYADHTKPLVATAWFGGHIMYSVIFATFMLDYTQLSLASYFIIGVLHRSGETFLGVHLTILSCSSELWKLNQRRW